MSKIAHITSEEAFDIVHPFADEGNLPMRKDKTVFCKNWNALIEAGTGKILGVFDPELCGALGFLIFPDINDGEISAIEAFWYVRQGRRGCGIKLLKEFERQAIASGATRLTVVHLSNLMPSKLKRVYDRLGYKPIEEHYMKGVK